MGPHRIELMDELGTDIQVLHIGNYWWYEADVNLARQINQVMDEGVAQWCDDHAERFVGLSAVSLQHPDLAAEQLEHAIKNLGLRGASVGACQW